MGALANVNGNGAQFQQLAKLLQGVGAQGQLGGLDLQALMGNP